MKLTIEQALQNGINAHKAGKLQDAESFYRAILRSQPLHPDANHNLGVLALSINKADKSLPFFKVAIKVSPNIDQFWVSYIKALIHLKNFDKAKEIIKERKKIGLISENLKTLEAEISASFQDNQIKLVKENTKKKFSEKRKKAIEQKKN